MGLPGIEVTARPVGGVDSSGMFCGPKELGWDTDVLDEKLAVALDDQAVAGTPAPSFEEVKALREKEKSEEKEKADKASADKKKKGKSAKKQEEDEDFDALLDQFKDPNAKEEPTAA